MQERAELFLRNIYAETSTRSSHPKLPPRTFIPILYPNKNISIPLTSPPVKDLSFPPPPGHCRAPKTDASHCTEHRTTKEIKDEKKSRTIGSGNHCSNSTEYKIPKHTKGRVKEEFDPRREQRSLVDEPGKERRRELRESERERARGRRRLKQHQSQATQNK